MNGGEEGGRPLALVTGASRGLGECWSRFLSGQGYDLVLTARGTVDLDRVAAELRRRGGAVEPVAGDLAELDHRAQLEAAIQRRGRLDLLIHNASELGPSPLRPLLEVPRPEVERVFAVNLLGPIDLTRRLLGPLARARGRVVTISSDAAMGGYPGWGAYGASKAALDLASKTLAAELAPLGISVVSVDPGDLRTALHQSAYPGEDISDRPLPEVTLPFLAWLLGQAAADVTGRRYRAQSDTWVAAPA